MTTDNTYRCISWEHDDSATYVQTKYCNNHTEAEEFSRHRPYKHFAMIRDLYEFGKILRAITIKEDNAHALQ